MLTDSLTSHRGGNGSKKGEKAENTSQTAAGSDPPVKPLSLDKLLSPLAGFAGARGSQPAATPAAADATAAGGGAQLLLRCGQLTLSAQVSSKPPTCLVSFLPCLTKRAAHARQLFVDRVCNLGLSLLLKPL